MSKRHVEVLRQIQREYDNVVTALDLARRWTKKGAPGSPHYDPTDLDDAIETAGDAYSLLLIATAEGFLRQYLESIQVTGHSHRGLDHLIRKATRELQTRLGAKPHGTNVLADMLALKD